MVGRRKKESFQNLKDRFKQRIENWSEKKVFIKAILQAIPTYTMAYFLLPKSLCVDLEKGWWQKGHSLVCLEGSLYRKRNGWFGFRNLGQFNIALLAKQGWRFINFPNSLLENVLKAKYYPNSDFINAQLGNLPSLTWKSVWAAKGLLKDGLCWRVERIYDNSNNAEVELVLDLIDASTKKWKIDLIVNSFQADTAQKILQIPLAEEEHDDFQVWRGKHFGEFLVKSAYKLLQEANMDPNISCPRCRNEEEDSNHVFRQCPTTTGTWQNINLSWLVHEGKLTTGRDLSNRIQCYIAEINGLEEKPLTSNDGRRQRQEERHARVAIYFDATFDGKYSRLTSGLVVWGDMGEFLASKTVLHSTISSPFMAEAHAGLQAVKLGISMGFQSVNIIGDSNTVIKKCNSAATDKSVIEAII
ncbi:RNA-directed DNA polymerase [Gossypium australe]|uniref:RNA-directed DNA polymerase n=1 Tax=Gossypium australe TaxID=47621 RepID=A0A5B6UZA7_9ROSI|nr:RNA-directed DNA polymerase [Gossypium australe]